MGGTESKSNTQVIGEIISSNVTRNVQNCTKKIDIKQELIADGGENYYR